MIQAEEAIRVARGLIGTAYSELDCINLVKKVIRTAPGGDKRYTTAGTNALWDSDSKRVGTGDVSHTGLVTEQGTVIHSSKSRGGVVETALTAKAGWNGLGAHRMIEAEGSGYKSAGGERAGSAEYGRVIVCAGGGLRMRVKPNGRYMQMIPDGTRLAVLEEKDGWLRTVYRGHTGWISGTYCCKAGED